MNLQSYVVLAVVLFLAAAACRYLHRRENGGCFGGCGGDCSHCGKDCKKK
ncbi:MAG: FeoB-associated Cys-rich membrane protein [Lachnospiraceae bacterium]